MRYGWGAVVGKRDTRLISAGYFFVFALFDAVVNAITYCIILAYGVCKIGTVVFGVGCLEKHV